MYDSNPISKKLFENPSQLNFNLITPEILSNLARFTNTRITQLYIYIVQILRMLESNIDNKRDNKPNTLKQTMQSSD